MKVLLIEDDSNKSAQILEFLKSRNDVQIAELRKSYQSGLKEILTSEFDLILLDMQLPTFDIKYGEDGYKFRELAGVDIMNELTRKKKECKIIIITQFETFGEGDKLIELEDLKKRLSSDFNGMYINTVYYSASQTKWKVELDLLIKKIVE